MIGDELSIRLRSMLDGERLVLLLDRDGGGVRLRVEAHMRHGGRGGGLRIDQAFVAGDDLGALLEEEVSRLLVGLGAGAADAR